MKIYLALITLTLSLQSYAVDMEKYCLPFLNGQLESQGSKPEIMEGFVATKAKMDIAGNMVDTINILPEDIETKGDVKVKKYPWGEETSTTILKFKKNGKPVKDYTLIVSRDKAGNLISVRKKPVLLQDFKLSSETIYFKPQKDVCIPEKFIGNNKLKFSVDLCREIDRFFVENPSARDCLVSRHDQKLAALVKEHAKSLEEKVVLSLEKRSEDLSAVYAAKHRVDCSEHGLDVILGDKAIWEEYVGRRGEERIKESTVGKEQ